MNKISKAGGKTNQRHNKEKSKKAKNGQRKQGRKE
jgi:hypothetical protein